MALTVHHLEMSRSQRILWLLEELGVPYTLKMYRRDPQTKLAPSALKEIHPLGKSPVITDGELVIAESGAIIEYLVETYGAQAPSDLSHLQPVAQHTGLSAVPLLDALCRRLTHELVGHEAGV
jgi:Glutathione S-transferase